jgi:NADH dehydrogenase [ubiquinone] 1 alpha subcomplex assembly factor 5
MSIPILFDDRLKAIHRARAAKLLPGHEALVQEAAGRLAEKFEDEIPQKFPAALEIGARGDFLEKLLREKAGMESMQHADALALPATPESFDLATSCLALHWVNDLPGCFRTIHGLLKPGGLFLANLLGGETLKELRASLMAAELSLSGGTSPRISPFTLVKDAGMLLQRAGFTEPVAYGDTVTVLYRDIFGLIADLRALGETSTLVSRNKKIPPRALFALAYEVYKEKFATKDGYIPATFDIITLTAWR